MNGIGNDTVGDVAARGIAVADGKRVPRTISDPKLMKFALIHLHYLGAKRITITRIEFQLQLDNRMLCHAKRTHTTTIMYTCAYTV